MTKSPETNEVVEVQQTHYYPFGGIIADISWGRDVQKRLYNGKELDTSCALYWYDYGARQYDATCSINGSTPYTLVSNSYDEVGRLVGDQRNGLAALQTTNTYNVRSWPTSMGCPAFSEQLTYNEDPGHACYGGNISKAVWSTDGFATSGGYRYTYDALSRLTQADYVATPDSLAGRYSTRYAYDLNGNATSIVRKGMDKVSGQVPAPWNPNVMVNGTVPLWCTTDSMSLAYEGNRLVSVSDEGRHLLGADLFGFSDGTEEEIEYEYDENGNTVKDLNRKVSSIQYNSLNLPSKVTLTDGSYARYDYDAAGRKLKSYYHIGEDLVVGPGLDPIPFPGGLSGGDGLMSVGGEAQIAYLRDSIEYCGNVLYDNGHLDKVFVDGGYATLNATTGQPTFHFYVRDHLGSIRRIVRQDGVVERTNHYYPYGGLHGESTGTTNHRFRFSGKEYDPMLGLNSYDFSARWQMPDLTRFGQMDPLAEKTPEISPYAYCAGDPVNRIDPDGRDWFYYSVDGKSEATWNWHDGHEYHTGIFDEDGNEVILQGQEAVVEFNGYYNERLGDGELMDGDNALLADITVYGPKGASDISHYKGYSMTSNPSRYGVVKDGDYMVTLLGENEKAGPYGSKFALNNRGKVPEWTDYNPSYPSRNPAYLIEVFIHRSNWNGYAGEKHNKNGWTAVSKGCLLIHPNDWRQFENQLKSVNKFLLQLRRK